MELKNLHEILVFLGREPEAEILSASGLQDGFYEKELVSLYEAMEEYGEVNLKDNLFIDEYLKDNSKKGYFGSEFLDEGDKLIYNLTKVAYGTSKSAGYACYILGCIYDKRKGIYRGTNIDRYDSIAVYFFGEALKKGYDTTGSRKAYAEACTRMGWFDTALYWYPEEDPLCFVAKAFLKHRMRYCEERGVTFPKTENHFVCIEKSEEAKAFEEEFTKSIKYRKDFLNKMEELEKSLPPLADNLYWRIDYAEEKIIRKKRWAPRFAWILYLVLATVFLFAVDGNENISSQIAGVWLGLYTVFTFVTGLFLKYCRKKKYSKMYAKAKRKIYDEYKIGSLLKQNDALSFNQSMQVKGEFKDKNAVAVKLHKLLTSGVNFVEIPTVYYDVYGEEVSENSISILDDYDAFSRVMTKFEDKVPYVLLWSGDELAYTYYDLDSIDEFEFSNYFAEMFRDAAEADGKKANAYASELKRLNEAIETKNRRYVYESSGSSSSSSADSSESSGSGWDDFHRSVNLWAYGTYGTDEEIIDQMYMNGKMDEDTYRKATTYGWRLSDFD